MLNLQLVSKDLAVADEANGKVHSTDILGGGNKRSSQRKAFD